MPEPITTPPAVTDPSMAPATPAPTAPVPGVNDPAFAPKVLASATLPTNWHEDARYKEHYAGNETIFDKYKSEDEYIKGTLEAAKMVGKRGAMNAEVPKADDPAFADKMNTLYDTMGRHKTADAYEIKLLDIPEALQSRVAFSPELQTAAKELAFKHRVSQEALADFAELQQKTVIDAEQVWFDKRVEQAETAETELKKSPTYEAEKALTDRLLAMPEYESLVKELAESNLGNFPAMFKIVAAHAKLTIGEGSVDPSKNATGGQPASANKEMTQYELDKARHPHSPSLWRGKPTA